MSDEQEISESGQPIIRHAPRTKDFELAIGDGESIEKLEGYIESHLGKIEMVYHEIISDLVHIDVYQIPPRPGRNFWTLVTTGMSNRPMTVPEGSDCSPYAELMICLPSSWPVSEQAFKDENHYWPVRVLKWLSHFPHVYDTWLTAGHTVNNGDPPEPFASNVDFCCALLLKPVTTPPEFGQFEIKPGKIVEFLGIYPLFPEEVDLKLKKGTDALLKRFAKTRVTELMNPNRKNVAK